MAQANVKLTVDGSQATRALQGVQNKTTKLNGGINRLKTAIAGVGLTVLARQAVNTSANFAKLNVRLGLLTKASGTFARSQEIAAEAQKSFGLSATEALEGITDITARLQPLGVAVEDIRTTFIGFNTAAKLAGASAMESSNAFRQLAQALGSGRLQGDEFRSIAEQVPTLLAPIAKELNTTVGGLKKFASEGKLTSDVVIRALKKVEVDGAASLKALLENDPTQVFKDLGNEAENLSRAFGDLLAPAVLPVIRGITDLTAAVTTFLNSPIGTTAAIFAAIAVAAKGVAIIIPIVTSGLIALAAAGGLATVALNALPFVAVATLVGGFTTAIIKASNEQRDFNKALKEGDTQLLKSQFNRLFIQRQKLLSRLATAQENNNKRAIASLQRQLQINKDQITPIKEKLDEDRKTTAEIDRQNEKLKEQEDLIKKNKEAAAKLKEKMTEVGEEIEGSIKNNLRDAITGAQSFGQAMTNVLNKIRDKIIDAQIDKLLGNFGESFGAKENKGGGLGGILGGALGGLLGGLFANGGRPPVGKASIVGERGPELFVPKVAGTIIPNNAIGGGDNVTNMVTVNVDAAGSSVAGNSTDAQALGAAIGAAVQAQLIKEKRPGGILTR